MLFMPERTAWRVPAVRPLWGVAVDAFVHSRARAPQAAIAPHRRRGRADDAHARALDPPVLRVHSRSRAAARVTPAGRAPRQLHGVVEALGGVAGAP